MTKSEEILARKERYNRIERVVAEDGRTIGVRLLKPSQDLKVQELAPGLNGQTALTLDTGETIMVSRLFPLKVAAAVCEIDGNPIPFPKNRPELDSALDMLDQEGMAAAFEGWGKLNAPEKTAEGDEAALDPKP